MDRRSDEPERLPGIESGAFELVGVHGLTFEQAIEGVHEPDFAGASGRGALKNIEDLRCNDEAADGSQVRGGVLQSRLFDDSPDFVQAGLHGPWIDDPVLDDLFVGQLLDRQDGVVESVVDVRELPDGWYVMKDDVIREENGEWLIAH